MMKGCAFAQLAHADFTCAVVFLFWTMDHRTRLVLIATAIDCLICAAFYPVPGSLVFILVFNVPSTNSPLLIFGIAIAVRQAQLALLWIKAHPVYSRNTCGRSISPPRVLARPVYGARPVFIKSHQIIVEVSMYKPPELANIWRQFFQKRTGNLHKSLPTLKYFLKPTR